MVPVALRATVPHTPLVSRDRGVLLPITSAAGVYLSRQCSEWSTVASEGSLSLQVSFPASRGRQACRRNRVSRKCHGRLTDAIVPDLSTRFMQGERRGGDSRHEQPRIVPAARRGDARARPVACRSDRDIVGQKLDMRSRVTAGGRGVGTDDSAVSQEGEEAGWVAGWKWR